MKKIRMSNKYIEKMQHLGAGACSNVYYDPNLGLAIKLLKPKGMEAHDETNFSNLLGVENSTCVFPKYRVEVDDEFRGYAMEFVQGVGITEAVEDLEITTLINAIKVAEKDFRELSDKHIFATDVNPGEIMWSEEQNRLKIVDTDFFKKDEQVPKDKCYKKSIGQFYTILEMSLGMTPAQKPQLFAYLNKDEEYRNLYKSYIIRQVGGEIVSITELIEKMVQMLQKDFKTQIRTWGDMQKIIRENIEPEVKKDFGDIPEFIPPETSLKTGTPFDDWVTCCGTLKGINPNSPITNGGNKGSEKFLDRYPED